MLKRYSFENVSGWNGNAIPNGFVAGYSNPVVLQETNNVEIIKKRIQALLQIVGGDKLIIPFC